MHKMDNTPKILTIIGLALEGLSVFGLVIGGIIMKNLENLPFFDAELMQIPQEDLDLMLDLYQIFGNIMLVIGIIVIFVFIFNLVLFVKLIQGKFSEETAKKVYLYQAIWGGINLLSNTITGILYLVSGVTGRSGHVEEKNVRAGI